MRRAPGCLALLSFGLLLLLPFFLANAMLAALARLGLSPGLSLAAAVGIFLGGMLNIPVYRIPRDEVLEVPPVTLFGLGRMLPRLVRRRTYTTIAVNVGGCVIPVLLAGYELYRLALEGWSVLGLALVAVGLNTVVCWKVSKPVPELGIVMPALVPALVATLLA